MSKTVTKREFKSIDESLNFWDFDVNPVFEGIFHNKTILGEESARPFEVNIFAEDTTGEMFYINCNHAIEKAISKVKNSDAKLSNVVFRFEYLGKTEVDGKPFKRFKTAYAEM